MLVFVICFNFALTVINVLFAIRLYFYYRQLQGLTRRLNRWQRCAHRIFSQAPDTLGNVAVQTQHYRQTYVLLLRRYLKIQALWQLWRWLPKPSTLIRP